MCMCVCVIMTRKDDYDAWVSCMQYVYVESGCEPCVNADYKQHKTNNYLY